MEENNVVEEKKKDYSVLIGILGFIAMILGFIGFIYSLSKNCPEVLLSRFEPFIEIEKGSEWTNGNTRVRVLRSYKNKVIYTRYSYSGRARETCTLSKKVFCNRYARIVN